MVTVSSPACTTRGFTRREFRLVGELIATVLDGLVEKPEGNAAVESEVRRKVLDLTRAFPIYPDLV